MRYVHKSLILQKHAYLSLQRNCHLGLSHSLSQLQDAALYPLPSSLDLLAGLAYTQHPSLNCRLNQCLVLVRLVSGWQACILGKASMPIRQAEQLMMVRLHKHRKHIFREEL